MRMVDAFLSKRYRVSADFVSKLTRDFVRAGHTPILVLADDVPTHLYNVAMETAVLAPLAQMSLYPPKIASRSRRTTCLQAHRPQPRSR